MDFLLSDAVAVLARTPRTLRALLTDLPPAWCDAVERPETWSPTMVVAHLLSADRTNWIPRVRILLADGAREFPPFDREAQVRAMQEARLPDLLDAFERERADSLAQLAQLDLGTSDLHRTGIHPEFGTITLGQLLATWTTHDLSHLAQITRVMAVQYREAVGPWRAYLRILQS